MIENVHEWNLWYVFLASLMIMLVVVYFSIKLNKNFMMKKYKDDRSKGINNIGIGYYAKRQDLGRPIDQFEYADTIFCLWHGVIGDAPVYTCRKIKKLLLISPEKNKEQLYQHCIKTTFPNLTIEAFSSEVIGYANKYAKDNNIEVRILNETPTFLFNILNPYNSNGRIQLEEFNLEQPNKDEWQTFTIEKEKQPYLFKTLLDYYESLWQKGKKPNWMK
uniref:Uncharacterized protein n=1 Tax=viral metagenome TaxID=1070528 RepID=A0A6M3KUG9_9ZZZZ